MQLNKPKQLNTLKQANSDSVTLIQPSIMHFEGWRISVDYQSSTIINDVTSQIDSNMLLIKETLTFH